MQSGKRLLLFCFLVFTALAEEPLVLSWKIERQVPPLQPGEFGRTYNSLHLHHPERLTFIYRGDVSSLHILRLDIAGNPLFERRFYPMTNGGFNLRKTALDPSGTIILAGHREWIGTGDTTQEMHVIQLDSAGNEMWRHRFADAEEPADLVHDLLLDSQNNIYVSGSLNSEFFVAKLSPAGSLLWQTNYPAFDHSPVSAGYALALHPNGSLYVADRNRLFRFSTDGEKIWEKPTGMLHDTMRIAPSGAIFLSLRKRHFINDPQYLGKFDESGELIALNYDSAPEFEILPNDRPMFGFENYMIVRDANGETVHDYLRGPVEDISDIILQPSGRISVSGLNGVLQLRPDLTRAAFYPETSARYVEPTLPPVVVATATNIYRGGIYHGTNSMWAEVRAWAATNSPAVPRILEHPEGATILAGQDFTTGVRAAEAPSGFELSYQWFHSTSEPPFPIEGATNSSLLLTNLEALYMTPPHPRSLFVRATNSLGIVYSQVADLWVHVVPNLTNAPVPNPSLAYAGDRVTWRIDTKSTSPQYVQWYKDALPIPGANSRTYLITNAGPEHLGLYSVYISNVVGASHSPATPFTNLLTNVSVQEISRLRGLVPSLPLLRRDGAENMLAVHSRNEGNGYELVVAKFDSGGEMLWRTNANFLGNAAYGSPLDVPQSLALNSQGDIFLAGSTPGSSATRKPGILQLNSNGEILGEIVVTSRVTRISSILADQSGDIFIGGIQENGSHYVALSLSPTGEQKWYARIPAAGFMHRLTWMQLDSQTNILFAAAGSRAVYSFSSTGATNWIASLGSFSPFDLESAPDGTFYLSGLATNRPALVRITPEGTVSPIQVLPHVSSAIRTDLQIDPDGVLYYLAQASSSVGPRPTLSRLNTNGTPVWSASFFSELAPAFSVAGREAIYVAGSYNRSPAESGLMKYDSSGVRRWMCGIRFPEQPSVAAANDSVVFAAVKSFGGDVPLLRVEDHEDPEVREQSAEILAHVSGGSLQLESRPLNADLLRVRWFRPGSSLPLISDAAPILQIPFPANAYLNWSAEVTTPDAVLVTPDFYPKIFATLLTPERDQLGRWFLRLHGPASGTFTLQSSLDLTNWIYIDQGLFTESGTAFLQRNFAPDVTNHFFRLIRR